MLRHTSKALRPPEVSRLAASPTRRRNPRWVSEVAFLLDPVRCVPVRIDPKVLKCKTFPTR
jgi:hypothetical protein